MRVLVTGAGGFVCRHIVEALTKGGAHVHALDQRFDSDLLQSWSGRIEASTGDLPDEQFDLLIHGAAVTGAVHQKLMGDFRVNMDAALFAMEWAADHTDRALFISSSGIYDRTAPGPISEDWPARPQGLYAVAKYTIERLVETFAAEHGMQWATVRLSNIYGPGERVRTSRPRLSLVGNMIHEALTAAQITVPAYEAARDWTFAPDVGETFRVLAEASHWSYALYNVASEQQLTADEIAAHIAQLIPDVALQRVAECPSDRLPLTRLGYLSNARFVSDIGFDQWTPLMDGLRETVQWMREAALAGVRS